MVWSGSVSTSRYRTFRISAEIGDPAFIWAPYKSDGQWKANAARMIENLADFSHFPWVHAGILGDPDQAESPVIELKEVTGGFQYEIDTPVNRLRPAEPVEATATRSSCRSW